MTRDYSQFLPPRTGPAPQRRRSTLDNLGWQPFFAQQTDVDTLVGTPPVRVTETHRNMLHVIGESLDATVPAIPGATTGDWLLLDSERPQNSRILERKSLIKRRAPGNDRQLQLIVANIDTAFVVSSCNQDFNIARMERYIALAFEADITPVILLTKSDLCDAPEEFVTQASTISGHVPAIAIDAKGEEPRTRLAPWCRPGQTVAFLGSSGVGKSTLTNALIGTNAIATRGIRNDDSKGRHTTTTRQLHLVPGGCAVLDTPGMRELQLADAAAGVDAVFSDLQALAADCRFRDCQHQSEPGCAVRAAADRGDIDPARLARWTKLAAEDAFNSATLAQRRSRDKTLGKTIRQIQKLKQTRD